LVCQKGYIAGLENKIKALEEKLAIKDEYGYEY